jgi:ribonuclease-3
VTTKASIWLAKSLVYEFTDVDLLQQALTHRSCPGANNERLEFLGDAVLGFVVADVIYHAQKDASEGDLSKLRASLVKSTSLAELAVELELSEHLILGGGERKSGGHRRKSILADTLEAIFGAVYLDSDFAAAVAVVKRAFGDRLVDFPSMQELRDPKTQLQEWLQARGLGLPDYELIKVTGKAHLQRFDVSCSIQDRERASTGSGTTRRNAEQESAREMLIVLGEEVKSA